ncbi:hypothetical protein EVAR_60205_1 [Eumeta japonica]|uniref:Uncharacterized protein n=1 Tax=Eumeta variegata TaxID=151549 RepID=A0A4C1Z603_EUMVA|nr:hypothetical protein EVAR_60205_1 [Eumeta japonica]
MYLHESNDSAIIIVTCSTWWIVVRALRSERHRQNRPDECELNSRGEGSRRPREVATGRALVEYSALARTKEKQAENSHETQCTRQLHNGALLTYCGYPTSAGTARRRRAGRTRTIGCPHRGQRCDVIGGTVT